MILITSQVISDENQSGLITANNLALINLNHPDMPDTWNNYGYINIIINDENIPNKSPVIFSTNLLKNGFLYIPNHSYDYQVLFSPKTWLLNLEPLALFEVYQI